MMGVIRAWGRAVLAQLQPKMLLLTVLPFFLSLLLWGALMWWRLQALIDGLQEFFTQYDAFKTAGELLGALGLIALKAVIVPLTAMWLLLPLMIVTALICIGVFAMPTISSHVALRDYPQLERRHGGTLLGALWRSLSSSLMFALLWLLSLPLTLLPPAGLLVQPLLWGWLTYRVMVYDALAEHADAEERETLTRRHRLPLLLIGSIAGILGAAPSMLWLGGVLSVVFFPLLAGISIWLYVLVFIFTGLWFQYYCLEALRAYREERAGRIEPSLQSIST